MGRAKTTGGLLLERLRGLSDLEIVGEVRGVGMMLAVELVSDRGTREPLLVDPPVEDVVRRDSGVIVRNCGHNVVLSPPLSMTDAEAHEVADGLESVLRRLRPDGTYA